MRKKFIVYTFIPLFSLFFQGCRSAQNKNLQYSKQILVTTLNKYSVENTHLLRETYPFDVQHKATYLANEDVSNQPNKYSYLWPYSGSLTAGIALFEATKDNKYLQLLDSTILVGLDAYYDTKRQPYAYASYIKTAPLSDRFYDDNIWIGIDFTDLYELTHDKRFLDKALEVSSFIESGTDTALGGGIYWCEEKKHSKNACSNAPGSVFALKLFKATNDSSYFYKGKQLYEWTKNNLQDKEDFLYFDNININGNVDKAKYAYNSGQMIQAAALLYQLTNNTLYLDDAKKTAASSYKYFFHEFKGDNDKNFKLLNKGNVWFTAVMLRGYIELYKADKNREYIQAFKANLDYAWSHMRDNESGLFNTDWSGEKKDNSKWLLTQFAMVEMYARISNL